MHPVSSARIRITSDAGLEEALKKIKPSGDGKFTAGQQLYFLGPHLACPAKLYDSRSADVIQRFLYARDFGIPAFAGAYDEQPAWWLDALGILNTELAALRGCNCSTCRGRTGG